MSAADLIGWYLRPWRLYAVFRGRSRRREILVWHFGHLVLYLVFLALAFLGLASLSEEIGGALTLGLTSFLYLYGLAALVPSLALTVRRLHDLNTSGLAALLLLVPVVGLLFALYLLLAPGTPGPNRFGPPPPLTASGDAKEE